VAVNSIYASIIPSYKYNLVLKSFSYGTQVMGHPVQAENTEMGMRNGAGGINLVRYLKACGIKIGGLDLGKFYKQKIQRLE
jgi:hypothetical protein